MKTKATFIFILLCISSPLFPYTDRSLTLISTVQELAPQDPTKGKALIDLTHTAYVLREDLPESFNIIGAQLYMLRVDLSKVIKLILNLYHQKFTDAKFMLTVARFMGDLRKKTESHNLDQDTLIMLRHLTMYLSLLLEDLFKKHKGHDEYEKMLNETALAISSMQAPGMTMEQMSSRLKQIVTTTGSPRKSLWLRAVKRNFPIVSNRIFRLVRAFCNKLRFKTQATEVKNQYLINIEIDLKNSEPQS